MTLLHLLAYLQIFFHDLYSVRLSVPLIYAIGSDTAEDMTCKAGCSPCCTLCKCSLREKCLQIPQSSHACDVRKSLAILSIECLLYHDVATEMCCLYIKNLAEQWCSWPGSAYSQVLQGVAEGSGVLQPEDKEAEEKPYCCLLLPERRL